MEIYNAVIFRLINYELYNLNNYNLSNDKIRGKGNFIFHLSCLFVFIVLRISCSGKPGHIANDRKMNGKSPRNCFTWPSLTWLVSTRWKYYQARKHIPSG